ncbi:MAG: PilZ domain-containing protein [Rhodospirillales bacterium]|nr:PilZ domain-containing protein [Rhodospirillales bacterium]
MHVVSFVFQGRSRARSELAEQVAAAAVRAGDTSALVVVDNAASQPLAAADTAAVDVVHTVSSGLAASLEALAADGCACAIVAAQYAHDDTGFAAVLASADVVVVCVGPRKAELDRLDAVVGAVKQCRKPFFFVVDGVGAKGPKDAVVFYLAQQGTVCPVFVPQQAGATDGEDTIPMLWGYIAGRFAKLTPAAPSSPAEPAPAQRRGHPRWQARWDISVMRDGGGRDKERLAGRLVDISGSGAGITVDAALGAGETVCVDIPFVGHYAATVIHGEAGRYGLHLALDDHEQAFLAARLETVMTNARQTAEPELDPEPEPEPEPSIPTAPPASRAPSSVPQAAARRARVVVVGNLKGGSGKSTIAMHVIVGLLHEGLSVASVDLDAGQASLSRYIDNRRAHDMAHGSRLLMPECHLAPQADDDSLDAALDRLAGFVDVIVIDTPGRASPLTTRALALADVLITPINDSFLDLDVLAEIDPRTLTFIDHARFGETVARTRGKRRAAGDAGFDWLVMRNRLTNLDARNKRDMADTLAHLATALDFRIAPGLSERVIYRELFLLGLTLLDLRDQDSGIALTLSHVAARQELRALMSSIVSAPAMTRAECADDADRLTISACA